MLQQIELKNLKIKAEGKNKEIVEVAIKNKGYNEKPTNSEKILNNCTYIYLHSNGNITGGYEIGVFDGTYGFGTMKDVEEISADEFINK